MRRQSVPAAAKTAAAPEALSFAPCSLMCAMSRTSSPDAPGTTPVT
ncbi:MAG: hypothetical protein NZT92_09800 [Abditibacteriales bacterium]|nr:hypothetical protein [Abditibacteriales bacterium]